MSAGPGGFLRWIASLLVRGPGAPFVLGKNPVLTSVAVLSLAVGIPVGMAPVHVMDAFDAPPPVEDGDRLMGLRYRGGRGGLRATSYELDQWRSELGSFEILGAIRRIEHNLAPEGGVGTPVATAEVTASAFAALRTRPLLGRPLQVFGRLQDGTSAARSPRQAYRLYGRPASISGDI